MNSNATNSPPTRRFWVEKTLVKNRPDRQSGDNALGRALWSPQKSDGGSDIYRSMREVKPGDIVFHFIDNQLLDSFSVAAKSVDSTFKGLAATEWQDRPAYRVELEGHRKIMPPLDRKEFLEDPKYRTALQQLLDSKKGLFFNREFNLNQGAYLTEAPPELVQIWNDIHMRKTGHSLTGELGISSIDVAAPSASTSASREFTSEDLWSFADALKKAGYQTTPDFLQRFVSTILTKPFLIVTGNSGTGKTRLAQLLAQWLDASSDASEPRYAVVPVGADWTDNRSIVGFVNHLRPHPQIAGQPMYNGTPVLELMLRAGRDEVHPYFLILDEMNLSHVERYFADLLSAMESQRPVLLHGEDSALKTPAGLSVLPSILFPDNLFVIGTVNVDETTYMFSPKVLDRGNVIEFRIEPSDVEAFLNEGVGILREVGGGTTDRAQAFLKLSQRGRGLTMPPLQIAREHQGKLDNCKRTLSNLFGILQASRLEFAFRAMAEIIRYAHIDYELTEDKQAWHWRACMDAQILQKVLPKLHGSRKRLEPVLVDLSKYCETGAPGGEKPSYATNFQSTPVRRVPKPTTAGERDSVTFRGSYEKLCDMIDAVRRDQFVSFIQ